MTAASSDPRAWLAQLTDTHTAATKGPWMAATAPAEGSDETHAEYLANALRPDEGRPLWVAWAPADDDQHPGCDYVVPVVTGDGPTSEANARFAAAAHASMPVLLGIVGGLLDLADGMETPAHALRGAYREGYEKGQREAAASLRAVVAAAIEGAGQ